MCTKIQSIRRFYYNKNCIVCIPDATRRAEEEERYCVRGRMKGRKEASKEENHKMYRMKRGKKIKYNWLESL
jgi:hypothetical protein